MSTDETFTSASTSDGLPVGTIVAWYADVLSSGITVPKGWLLCNGLPFSKEVYPNLYKLLQHSGIPTPENTPDLRGMFLRGADYGRNIDPDYTDRQGGTRSLRIGSSQDDALQGHVHEAFRRIAGFDQGRPGEGRTYWGPNGDIESFGITGYPKKIADSGDETAFSNIPNVNKVPEYHSPRVSKETRPKNVYVNYIIRAE